MKNEKDIKKLLLVCHVVLPGHHGSGHVGAGGEVGESIKCLITALLMLCVSLHYLNGGTGIHKKVNFVCQVVLPGHHGSDHVGAGGEVGESIKCLITALLMLCVSLHYLNGGTGKT
jgi:hypothetical protein